MRKKLMGGEGLHASGSMVKIDLPKENVYGEKICKEKTVGLSLGLWVMVQKVELTRVMDHVHLGFEFREMGLDI